MLQFIDWLKKTAAHLLVHLKARAQNGIAFLLVDDRHLFVPFVCFVVYCRAFCRISSSFFITSYRLPFHSLVPKAS